MTPHFSSFPQITQPKPNPTADFFLTPPPQKPPGSPWYMFSLVAMNNKPSLSWIKLVHRSVPSGLWLEDVDFGMISGQPADYPSQRRTPPILQSFLQTPLTPQHFHPPPAESGPMCCILQTPCTPSCGSHCLSWQASYKCIESSLQAQGGMSDHIACN